jgi:hypothetical protein
LLSTDVKLLYFIICVVLLLLSTEVELC